MQLSRYDEGEPSRPDTERSRATKAGISGIDGNHSSLRIVLLQGRLFSLERR